jgi:hypothetical protein
MADNRRHCMICLFLLLLLLFIPLSLRTEHRASTVPHHPRLLFQFLGSIRHLVGLLGGGISPAQGLYLHRTTQRGKTQTNIHAPSRIRTCDPNVRAAEDSTCLRPLCVIYFYYLKFKLHMSSVCVTHTNKYDQYVKLWVHIWQVLDNIIYATENNKH